MQLVPVGFSFGGPTGSREWDKVLGGSELLVIGVEVDVKGGAHNVGRSDPLGLGLGVDGGLAFGADTHMESICPPFVSGGYWTHGYTIAQIRARIAEPTRSGVLIR